MEEEGGLRQAIARTGTGGTGGGGAGGTSTATNGTANLAVQEEGELQQLQAHAGNGGSGVVILRYADTFADLASIGGGLTYSKTTTGGYTIYTFTAGTGTVTV
jgi:hypothetical protein